MAEMVDAVVVADDPHMVAGSSDGRARSARASSAVSACGRATAAPSGIISPDSVHAERDQLADEQPGEDRRGRRRHDLAGRRDPVAGGASHARGGSRPGACRPGPMPADGPGPRRSAPAPGRPDRLRRAAPTRSRRRAPSPSMKQVAQASRDQGIERGETPQVPARGGVRAEHVAGAEDDDPGLQVAAPNSESDVTARPPRRRDRRGGPGSCRRCRRIGSDDRRAQLEQVVQPRGVPSSVRRGPMNRIRLDPIRLVPVVGRRASTLIQRERADRRPTRRRVLIGDQDGIAPRLRPTRAA